MTMDRGARYVRWSLYRDATCSEAACMLSGRLPVDLVRRSRPQTTQKSPDIAASSTHFALDSTWIQLAPELQQRLQDLLQREQGATSESNEVSMDLIVDAVPVAVEDLTLGSRAAELGLEPKTLLYCKLELDAQPEAETASSGQEGGWFSWKLTRAGEYRARGNEAFKQESYSSAVRLYKRALTWLEPPVLQSDATLDAKIKYSTEELQLVTPVAVACYANMATCYSRLNGDGNVDRCIAAASRALELDGSHVKARYRRSQAYASSKEFDLAVADLTKLRELEPDNKLFRSALARAQAAKTQLRKRQQSVFSNLFNT